MKKIDQPLRIVYDALSAFHSTRILSGSERQVYDANTMYFNPDRRLDPLTILVETGVNDPHGFVSGLVNEHLTDVVWRISAAGVLTTILDSDAEFKIGKNAEKGKLTIYKNIPDTEEVTITFSAKYLQAVGKRVANFQATFTLVTASEALAPAILELTAPYGEILYPFKNKNKGLVAEANLVRETENVAAAYWWYEDGVAVTDTNGFQNSTTNKLFVPMNQISKKGTVFSVEVADCSAYLQQLRNEWVDADAQVVEWRGLFASEGNNLLHKSKYDSVINFHFSEADYWRFPIYNSLTVGVDGIAEFKNISTQGATRLERAIFLEAGLYTLTICSKDFDANFSDSEGMNVIDQSVAMGCLDGYVTKIIYFNVPERDTVIIRGYYRLDLDAKFFISSFKLEKGKVSSSWSPNKSDLEALITQKQTEAIAAVNLPIGYRPTPKPTKLFKTEIVFIKRFGKYDVELLAPSPIPAEATVIRAELIVTNNQGVIENPENYFKAGWWKKANGSYTYEGFTQDIPIAELHQLISDEKGWDIEVDEI